MNEAQFSVKKNGFTMLEFLVYIMVSSMIIPATLGFGFQIYQFSGNYSHNMMKNIEKLHIFSVIHADISQAQSLDNQNSILTIQTESEGTVSYYLKNNNIIRAKNSQAYYISTLLNANNFEANIENTDVGESILVISINGVSTWSFNL